MVFILQQDGGRWDDIKSQYRRSVFLVADDGSDSNIGGTAQAIFLKLLIDCTGTPHSGTSSRVTSPEGRIRYGPCPRTPEWLGLELGLGLGLW